MFQVFDSIEIKGYRGFKKLELSQLGQFNIFVGLNNSGKTSLIEAISILCNPLDPFHWLELAQNRFSLGRKFGVRPNVEALKWVFNRFDAQENDESQGDIIGMLSIAATGKTPILGLEAKLTAIHRSKWEIENSDTLPEDDPEDESDSVGYGVELQVLAKIRPEASIWLKSEGERRVFQFWENQRFVQRDRPKHLVNFAPVSPVHISSKTIMGKLTPILQSEDRKDRLLEIIRWFDDKITDIQTFPIGDVEAAALHIKHQDLGWAPVDVFGDGLRRAVVIAVTLMSIENGVLLVDEIETSIHNSALSPVFSWLVAACHRLQVQLFVTTHSLEAIDAILQAEMSTDNLVAFRIHPSGEPPQRFTHNLLHRLRYERGLDIRG
ncbi:MAG: hypothetical protein Fur0025_19770 [Oscillatoriaceae cyanobacterium]